MGGDLLDMSDILNIEHEMLNGIMLIKLFGEVDISTFQEFKETLSSLVDLSQSDIKIDCNELTYIDSTGLGALVSLFKRAKGNGKTITIINLKENIKRLFLITKLDKLFNIEE